MTKEDLEQLEKLLFKFKGLVEHVPVKQHATKYTIAYVCEEIHFLKFLKDDKIKSDDE